jgi:hypothetical protein
MKRIAILFAALLIIAGCGKKPVTNEEVRADLAARLDKAGVRYMTIMVENGLATIDMRYCDMVDLKPLTGMPINSLNLAGNPVSDLAPLKGLQLANLDVSETMVADLAPLQGMPLKSLNLAKTPVADLTPLAGMKLEWFSANKCEKVTSIEPLRGMPLKSVNVSFTGVTDLSPCAGMPLESIWFLPGNSRGSMGVLRGIDSLQNIGTDSYLTMPAAYFWERYGG